MHTYDRNYFKIALPAALEGLFMILLASTDLIMVGALGALSIAAVSIFMQPRLILLCFSRSLASSVTLLVSQKAGAGDTKGTSDIMKKSLTVFCTSFSTFFWMTSSTSWARMTNTWQKPWRMAPSRLPPST